MDDVSLHADFPFLGRAPARAHCGAKGMRRGGRHTAHTSGHGTRVSSSHGGLVIKG